VVKETVYLGVTLDNQLYFRTHIIRQSQKARRAIDKVARLAMREFSLNTQGRRTLYKGVFEGIFLYACSVWTHRLINSTYRKHILRAQRHALCRLFGAYSDTSLEVLSLIIAEPLIHLTAVFRAAKYFVTKAKPLEADSLIAGFSTMDKFQRKETLYNLWDQWLLSSDRGRAAKAIFPNIRERLKCNWVDPTGDTIRILSEHGPFETYLHDRTLSKHPNCPTDGLRDDPNHAVFALMSRTLSVTLESR